MSKDRQYKEIEMLFQTAQFLYQHYCRGEMERVRYCSIYLLHDMGIWKLISLHFV